MTGGAPNYSRGLVPVSLLCLVLGGLGFLFRLAIGDIERTAGEVLFFVWPTFFIAAGLCCAGLAVAVGKRSARPLGLVLGSTGEVVSYVVAAVFSAGFFIGLVAVLVIGLVDLPNVTVSSKVWTGIAIGTGCVCGGVAAPSLAGAAMLRLGLSRSLIMFMHGLLFVAGVLLAIVLWRYDLLADWPLLLTQVVGALCATPLGAMLFRIVAPRAAPAHPG